MLVHQYLCHYKMAKEIWVTIMVSSTTHPSNKTPKNYKIKSYLIFFLGFLSVMPPVVSHYSVLPLEISTAQKWHCFIRHILKNATKQHYCDLKSLLPCYNDINTYEPTCQLSLYLTTIKYGAHLIPTAFLFSCKIIRLVTPDKRGHTYHCENRLIFVI